jgi:hypothetical protein
MAKSMAHRNQTKELTPWFLNLVLLQSKKSYSKLLKIYFFMPYDALNGSFVEQYILP